MRSGTFHVCLISEEYPPETGWGGIGTYTYNLARGLVRAGHRVTVIAGCIGEARTFTEEGITIHRIGFAPPHGALKQMLYRALQLYAADMPYFKRKVEFARAAWGLFRGIYRPEKMDIVETSEYDANAFFIARSHFVPLVVKIHTPVLLNYNLNGLPVTKEVRRCDFLERDQANHAQALTTPSRKMAELAAGWLKRKRDIRVLPNPIDTDEFTPDGPAAGAGKYLFYTGRLEKRKGVHVLLEAFGRIHQQIPEVRLVLAGHDTPTFTLPDRKEVFFMEYARQKGLLDGLSERVEFLGKVDRRQLPPLYRGSLGCVFPSASFENFPYSCLEAMSCGKAAIVTDAGGMAEMVENDRSGICVPAGSVEKLAEAMLRLAGSTEIAGQMGREARQRVLSEYSMEKMTGKTVELYQEVIDNERSRRA